LSEALAQPEVRKRFTDQGFQVTPLTHEQFAAFIRAERAKWTKLVREVGIEPQ
jgi:tripartite-type tricarboxylate transporter receptor subunit TctC